MSERSERTTSHYADPDTRSHLDQLIARSTTLAAAVELAERTLATDPRSRQRARELRRLADRLRGELDDVRWSIGLLRGTAAEPVSRPVSSPSPSR